ncbi:MAG: hypothetical protein O2807_13445 [bacterium]|nr:hypothetical protein [bacterium]
MASSNYKMIGEGIAAELSAIEGAGQVHTYQRWAADLGKYLHLFRWEAPDGKDQIRGWMVTREKVREEPGSFAGSGGGFLPAGVNRRTHTFLLFGLMSAEDAAGSELIFQDLIEALCDRFRDPGALRLRGRVPTLERLAPPAVDAIELRAFGGVLCHIAEIRIQAIERIVRG